MNFAGTDGRASSRGVRVALDPNAMATLARAAKYLRSLPELNFTAEVTRDEILHSDFKLQRTQSVRVKARRPDRLRIEVSGDPGERLFVYDGKHLSVYVERENLFARLPTPPTILESIDAIEPHALELPLIDIIFIAMGGRLETNIKEAADIGTSLIDGSACRQLAFRSEAVDWQLWTQLGDLPLPRKLVITTRDEATRPQYSALIRWRDAPPASEQAFMFSPPPDAMRMTITPALVPSAAESE